LTPWLETVADTRTTGEVLQAVGEAAANAMRHARPEEGGEIAISATCAGDTIEICVRDWSAGGWEPGGTDHGRGLVLMEALTDELVILQHHDGSEVVLRRTIP